MYGGVGWLVEVTADGYVMEVGSEHEVAAGRPSGDSFTIDRQEATAVKLKFSVVPGSPDWLRHDDPKSWEGGPGWWRPHACWHSYAGILERFGEAIWPAAAVTKSAITSAQTAILGDIRFLRLTREVIWMTPVRVRLL